MKKSLILLSFIASAVTTSHGNMVQSSGSKFYIELNGGIAQSAYRLKGSSYSTTSTVVLPNIANGIQYDYILPSIKGGEGEFGGTAGLAIGYDCKLRNTCLVLGLYAGGGLLNTSHRPGLSDQLFNKVNNVTRYSQLEQSDFTIRTRGYVEAGCRMGWQIGCFLPFLSVGWRGNDCSMSWKQPEYDKAKVRKNISSIVAGLGCEYVVSEKLIIGIVGKCSLSNGKTFSFANKVLYQTGSIDPYAAVKAKTSTKQFMITAKYAMSVCN